MLKYACSQRSTNKTALLSLRYALPCPSSSVSSSLPEQPLINTDVGDEYRIDGMPRTEEGILALRHRPSHGAGEEQLSEHLGIQHPHPFAQRPCLGEKRLLLLKRL